MSASRIRREKGSFRDPSGFVFLYEDNVYRALDKATFEVIRNLIDTGVLTDLISKGMVIDTTLIVQETQLHRELAERIEGYDHFVQHRKIPFISYPYEWSFAMLADAAQLQLLLQQALIVQGFTLKDATAFNVQFTGSGPVFIDVPSIEPLCRRDVWIGYNQFCRMHLFPLLLNRYRNVPLHRCFLGSSDGISVEETYELLGLWQSMRPCNFIDVFLQYRLQKQATKRRYAIQQRLHRSEGSLTPQQFNLKRIERKVIKLAKSTSTRGHWYTYSSNNTYDEKTEEAKKAFVDKAITLCGPGSVLDLGANTGVYSMIAAKYGASVVAVDADHDSVDLLYRTAKESRANILPLCVDLANPSPPQGFCHVERRGFMDRLQADMVLALALMHHMLITSRIPLELLRNFFHHLAKRQLVIEFIGREDPMFQTLLSLREDIYADITRDRFLDVFCTSFTLIEEQALAGTHRNLFLLERN